MKTLIHQLYICSFLVICLYSPMSGQQLQSWSSFYENGYVHNPALTARWNVSEVSITHRQNWTEFENAPEYTFAGIQYPFLRKETKVTMGTYVEQDILGPYSAQTLATTFAYKIRPQFFNEARDVLTFGIKAGAKKYSFEPNELTAYDGYVGDPLIPNLTSTITHPTVDIGIFYNSIDDTDRRNIEDKGHFFFGIAVRDIIPQMRIDIPLGSVRSSPHISLHGGYRYVPKKKRHYFEHNYFIDYAIYKAWLLMYNFRYEKFDKYWLSGGGVTNGDLFVQAGIILCGRDHLNSLLSNSGTLRIGAKANYNAFKIGNYSGAGFEVYIAYQFKLS